MRTPREDERAEPAGIPSGLHVGSAARSRTLGVVGELLVLRNDEAVLEAGGIRFSLAPSDLEPVKHGVRASNPVRGSIPMPEIAPATEVDLRGLRVDEVETALAPGLDGAVVNDVPSLRIIHGKGTGALRQEVARILDGDSRVSSYRAGGFQEGGSGVTVVEFKDTSD
jgi:DNA mismatch repair protein MutS2